MMAAPARTRGLKDASTTEDIRRKATDIIQDKKKSNFILEIIAEAEGNNEAVVAACINAFERVFLHFIDSREMYLDGLSATSGEGPQQGLYRTWLRDRYVDVKQKLLLWLVYESTEIQERSLTALMKLVEAEGKNPLQRIAPNKAAFPVLFFDQICQCLLGVNGKRCLATKAFQAYLSYDDVRYYFMKNVLARLLDMKDGTLKGYTEYLDDLYTAVELVKFPDGKEITLRLTKFLTQVPETEKPLKICSLKEHRKLFSTVWQSLLQCKLLFLIVIYILYLAAKAQDELWPMGTYKPRMLTERLFKKVLLYLPSHVMPYVTNTLILSDFFTESYNIGGVISLLALNGLFILIHKHNLDYPDFFVKLYALLQPGLFHVKYKARFFYLLDLFLQSTLLPAYLVAAFAKRLSRLALTAPPDGILLILPFVTNLLVRHKSCHILAHNEHEGSVAGDPYNCNESDLSQCNALRSSLWELKSMQNHYYHAVASAAKKLNDPLPQQELDLTPYLELTMDSLMQKETTSSRKKQLAEQPTASTGKGSKGGSIPINPPPAKRLVLVDEQFCRTSNG